MPRGNLDKTKILEAAAALANEISVKKLSLKQLAQKLNIQPPSLYNHVQSLDHLRLDLAAYGWDQAGARIAEALIGVSGDEAIRRACSVFYEYAEENPGVFEAMVYYNRENRTAGGEPDRLTGILYRLCRARDIAETDAVHVLRIFRSNIEGFALLTRHGVFPADETARESFFYGVEFLIAGIRQLERGGAGLPMRGGTNDG